MASDADKVHGGFRNGIRWAATVGTGTVNPSCDTSSGESHVRGTQSVRRALQLLRRVAKSKHRGARPAQLVREGGLGRAAPYRLMGCRVEEQFVDRDSEHLYRLGP